MKSKAWVVVLAAMIAGAGLASRAVCAADGATVVKQRQAAMKGQGRDLVVVRNYAQGKADQAAALAAVEAAKKSVEEVPSLFPPGTGIGQSDVKTRAKPEIWQQHDKFMADHKTVLGQLDELAAAVRSDDKAKVETVYAEIGGCKACHNDFRAKPQ